MTDFDDRMAKLRGRFCKSAGEQVAALEKCLNEDDWPRLRDLSHSLAGRAGMFGYPDIGNAARQVEEAVDEGRPHLIRSSVQVLTRQLSLLANDD